MKKINIMGLKYGHLTAIKYVRTGGKDCAAIWLFRCDCGNEKELQARVVTAGRTRTCGNCQLKHKLRGISTGATRFKNKKIIKEFQKYIRVAQRRGIKWALSPEEFNKLAHSECTMCNTPPPSSGINKVEPLSIEAGYTVGGCYVRCSRCEAAFTKVPLSQLIEQIVIVHRNLIETK